MRGKGKNEETTRWKTVTFSRARVSGVWGAFVT